MFLLRNVEVHVHIRPWISEQSFVSVHSFHEAVYKHLNRFVSLRFNAKQIVMSPGSRQKTHQIVNYCISMDTCVLRQLYYRLKTMISQPTHPPTDRHCLL
jgi:hypothetical protein